MKTTAKKLLYNIRNLWDLRVTRKGNNNHIRFKDAYLRKVRIDIQGNDNLISIASDTHLENCTITMKGSHFLLKIGNDCYFNNQLFCFEEAHASIIVGSEVVSYGGHMAAAEKNTRIVIGDNVILAKFHDIRTTDSHSILDRKTKQRINPGADVRIGNRAFIGEHATILKGVTIGDGAFIGIRSLAARDIPDHTLAAGVPAKILKDDIEWVWEKL